MSRQSLEDLFGFHIAGKYWDVNSAYREISFLNQTVLPWSEVNRYSPRGLEEILNLLIELKPTFKSAVKGQTDDETSEKEYELGQGLEKYLESTRDFARDSNSPLKRLLKFVRHLQNQSPEMIYEAICLIGKVAQHMIAGDIKRDPMKFYEGIFTALKENRDIFEKYMHSCKEEILFNALSHPANLDHFLLTLRGYDEIFIRDPAYLDIVRKRYSTLDTHSASFEEWKAENRRFAHLDQMIATTMNELGFSVDDYVGTNITKGFLRQKPRFVKYAGGGSLGELWQLRHWIRRSSLPDIITVLDLVLYKFDDPEKARRVINFLVNTEYHVTGHSHFDDPALSAIRGVMAYDGEDAVRYFNLTMDFLYAAMVSRLNSDLRTRAELLRTYQKDPEYDEITLNFLKSGELESLDEMRYARSLDWTGFRVVDKIGQGEFKAAYAAIHLLDGSKWVVKVPRTHRPLGDIKMQAQGYGDLQSLSEAEARKCLVTYDASVNLIGMAPPQRDLSTGLWILFERPYQDTLGSFVSRYERKYGQVPPRLCFDLMWQVACGLVQLHESKVVRNGIHHGDLRLDNIGLVYKGKMDLSSPPEIIVKLSDFGPASNMRYAADHQVTGMAGIDIRSREQFQHFFPSKQSDIWAFGANLYRLIYQRFPFQPDGIDKEGDRDLYRARVVANIDAYFKNPDSIYHNRLDDPRVRELLDLCLCHENIRKRDSRIIYTTHNRIHAVQLEARMRELKST